MRPATPQERASERLHEQLKHNIQTHERRPPPERGGATSTPKVLSENGTLGRKKSTYRR